MAEEITVFEHEQFGEIRIVDRDGEPWFIARDVARSLGYKDTDQAVRNHCDYATLVNTPSWGRGNPNVKIVPESDVYALIFGSKLPTVKAFKRWVCEDVLPSIRKTGSYSLSETLLPIDTLPKLLPVWDVAKAFAERAGFVGNQAALVAFKAVKRAHGVDIPELMGGTNLVAETQEQVFTPTEIGRKLDMGPQAVNKILERLSFQSVWRQDHKAVKAWQLTDKGKEFGTYLDVGKAYSDGTPIKQIKWTERVVPLIKEFRDKDRLLSSF